MESIRDGVLDLLKWEPGRLSVVDLVLCYKHTTLTSVAKENNLQLQCLCRTFISLHHLPSVFPLTYVCFLSLYML